MKANMKHELDLLSALLWMWRKDRDTFIRIAHSAAFDEMQQKGRKREESRFPFCLCPPTPFFAFALLPGNEQREQKCCVGSDSD